MKKHGLLSCLLLLAGLMVVNAQDIIVPTTSGVSQDPAVVDLKSCIDAFFENYKTSCRTKLPVAMNYYEVDTEKKIIHIYAREGFASQVFTPTKVDSAYLLLRDFLPMPYRDYNLRLYGHGLEISRLIPNYYAKEKDLSRLWRNRLHIGNEWVRNMSRPVEFSQGLQGSHLAVWASHGRYYDFRKGKWRWQRPNLFCTTEDLFTYSFVVPFLIPMLENAGAVVYTPRERDQHSEEIIVDNDSDNITQCGIYDEVCGVEPFNSCETAGFKQVYQVYGENQNPHCDGSARTCVTTNNPDAASTCHWIPSIAQDGDYAVYVTYPATPLNVSDVVYTVRHRNIETHIRVNQQMGAGIWVYLGTFSFDKGCSLSNSVSLSNYSESAGVVVADAVRIGGGMGNIARNGKVSGMPRYLEGARYFAQWAGMPEFVYNTKDGRNDYADDINVRSNSLNYLAGGSVYVPDTVGLKVPLELSLAMHSDAGYRSDNSTIGTLSIYTHLGERQTYDLLSGVSRLASSDYAALVQDNICRDLTYSLGRKWNRRELYNRDYSECRKPEVPSMILETLSHQNFQDMLYGHDPNFKFLVSRAIYKATARFVATQHQRECIIQPLPVRNFCAEAGEGNVRLSWQPRIDSLELTAFPTSYIVYTSKEGEDFDNGRHVVGGQTTLTIPVEKDVVYRFKVSACNAGGESFPSEVLAALCGSAPQNRILIVNGFTRMSAPAVVSTSDSLGFNLRTDIGVPYINTSAFCGAQTGFSRSKIGIETAGGLGYSGSELEGKVIAGNSFDYPSIHALSMRHDGLYTISSASMDALVGANISPDDYQMIDIIFGLQRDSGQSSIVPYKTFSPQLQTIIDDYLATGGNLLVSGAYIGSDMQNLDEQIYTAGSLNYNYAGSLNASCVLLGNKRFELVNKWNPHIYAATSVDKLLPSRMADSFITYSDGSCATVASPNTIVMGFPFESIATPQDRTLVMRRLIQHLLIKF